MLSKFLEVDTSDSLQWTKQTTSDFKGTKIKYFCNDKWMRLTYFPLQERFFIECSLPKILFYKNYRMICNQTQLQDALGKLCELIKKKIHVDVGDPLQSSVNKLDICWNFIVSDVDEYLNYLSVLPLPYHGYPIIFQNKTVTWKSCTEGLKFYDKFLESHQEPECKNMLRMELRMMHQAHFRKELGKEDNYNVKLNDFTFNFFLSKLSFYLTSFFNCETIEKNEKEITTNDADEQMLNKLTTDYLQDLRIDKENRILKFLLKLRNRDHLSVPKRTYYRYINELRKINFGSDIEPLDIQADFKNKVLLS